MVLFILQLRQLPSPAPAVISLCSNFAYLSTDEPPPSLIRRDNRACSRSTFALLWCNPASVVLILFSATE